MANALSFLHIYYFILYNSMYLLRKHSFHFVILSELEPTHCLRYKFTVCDFNQLSSLARNSLRLNSTNHSLIFVSWSPFNWNHSQKFLSCSIFTMHRSINVIYLWFGKLVKNIAFQRRLNTLFTPALTQTRQSTEVSNFQSREQNCVTSETDFRQRDA